MISPRLATTTADLALGSFIFNTYFPPVFFLGCRQAGFTTSGFWGRYCLTVPGGVEWSHCNLITESNETLGLKIWALGGDPWTEKVNFRETQQAEIFDVKDSHW